MKLSGFFLIVAMFFLGGCLHEPPREEQNLIAQVQAEQQTALFEKPMKAAFLIDIRGELYSFEHPNFEFQSERAYLSPQAQNIVYFQASDVTWAEFLETLGVKVENTCLVLPEETVCPGEGEKLQVVINRESMSFDPERKIMSGDRLYLGVIAGDVTRDTLARMPDPWMGEE